MFRKLRRKCRRRARRRKLCKNLQLVYSVLGVMSTVISVANELRRLTEASECQSSEVEKVNEIKAACETFSRVMQKCSDKMAEVSVCSIQNMRGVARICMEQVGVFGGSSSTSE